MISNEIELLNYLSKCSIEFGILDGEGENAIDVKILNTDDTITVQKMKVSDIMYFTEYGTITIPGKFILEKSLVYINRLLDEELDKLIDEIFEGDKTTSYINSRMEVICLKIQNYVRNYMILYTQNNNTLGQIIHPGQDENRYLFDLPELGKYITCRIKFKN